MTSPRLSSIWSLVVGLCGCSAAAPSPPPTAAPLPTSPAPTAPAEPGSAEPASAAAPDDNTTSKPFARADEDALERLVADNNAFAFDLYRRVAPSDGNFAMSPASISVALGMTYGGAAGETAAQMKAALHFSLGGEQIHDAFGTLLRSWEPGPKQPYELAVANRLFGETSLSFGKPYLALTSDHYAAPLEGVNFRGAPESARRHINDWVSDQTKARIEDLLPEGSLTSDARLVLANAIYFKGSWKHAFDDENTKTEAFHAPSGTKRVPMMHTTQRFAYSETDEVQVIEMPYEGDDLALQIVLPIERDGLGAIENELTAGALDEVLKKLFFVNVETALPRFKVDPPSPTQLKAPLSAMGMSRAFTAEAQFPHIAQMPPGEGLAIAEVFHKAFVEVNEEGTEAAAATGVTVFRTTSIQRPIEPKRFVADHPFLFLLRDKRSGAILFIGRVSSP